MNKLSTEKLIKYAEEKILNLTDMIDQSAFTNIKERLVEDRQLAQVGLDALREAMKGKLVPVAVVELNDNLTVAEIRGDMPRRIAVRELYEGALVIGQELFTARQKPVVVLTDCDIDAVSHMAHWYSEEQCEAWVAGVEHAKKQIEAAGCIVKTENPHCDECGGSGTYHRPQMLGTVECERVGDHQSSSPDALKDVLTAVSIGGSRTELIDALMAIKPKFGAPGSRDVDVRVAHMAINKAIGKLSNL